MKKKGNISFVALTALIVVCCGAAVLTIAGNTKYNAKTEYQRIEDRYIAESGIDTATGLFVIYLSNRDFVLPYEKTESGGYAVSDKYVPYLLDEIKNSGTDDIAYIPVIENECKDYLASVGYLEYMKDGVIKIGVNTFGGKDRFVLSEMCTQPDFLLSGTAESSGTKRSKLNPIFLTVKSKYRGGEVTANVKISNLYAVRKAFRALDDNDKGSVEAYIDTSSVKIEYENYQNYRGNQND